MITIKTKEEIKIMKEGGKILARVLKNVLKLAKPGITTNELNRAAEALILKHGAKPSFKGYMNFPYALCTSVNEEIVHVKPSDRALKEGDIVCLDLGVLYKGFHTDMAITVGVGKISKKAKELLKVAKKALDIAIKKVKPGINTNDIGEAIEKYIEEFEVAPGLNLRMYPRPRTEDRRHESYDVIFLYNTEYSGAVNRIKEKISKILGRKKY